MVQIVTDDKIRFGKPVIEGTRITVEEIIGAIAGGMTFEEIQEEYGVSKEDIKSALVYVNEVISQEKVGITKNKK